MKSNDPLGREIKPDSAEQGQIKALQAMTKCLKNRKKQKWVADCNCTIQQVHGRKNCNVIPRKLGIFIFPEEREMNFPRTLMSYPILNSFKVQKAKCNILPKCESQEQENA